MRWSTTRFPSRIFSFDVLQIIQGWIKDDDSSRAIACHNKPYTFRLIQTLQTYGTMEPERSKGCWAVSGFWNSKKGISLCKPVGANCLKTLSQVRSKHHLVVFPNSIRPFMQMLNVTTKSLRCQRVVLGGSFAHWPILQSDSLGTLSFQNDANARMHITWSLHQKKNSLNGSL